MNSDAQDANAQMAHRRWKFSGTPVSDDELEARFVVVREEFASLKTGFDAIVLRVAALNEKLQELRDDFQHHTFYHDPEPGE
jgi:hypothetical protein